MSGPQDWNDANIGRGRFQVGAPAGSHYHLDPLLIRGEFADDRRAAGLERIWRCGLRVYLQKEASADSIPASASVRI